MRFEGGKKREIATTAKIHDAEEERFKRFQAGRTKIWSQDKTFNGMAAPASIERESAKHSHDSAQERTEEHLARVESLEQEIVQLKESWITRLVEFKKLRDVEEKLHLALQMKAIAEQDKLRADQLVSAYDRIIAEDNELAELKMVVAGETQQSLDEQNARLEKDKEARTIGELAKKYNCFLVHDIVDADWKPSENNKAVDTKGLSWGDQFDILHGLGPTISGSSLREGVPEDGTFGKGSWGVFIQNGEVLGGAPSDTGTRAYGLYERNIPQHLRGIEDIDKAIDRQSSRIQRPGEKSYNELVIQRPEIAGIYFKWNPSFGEFGEEVSLQNVYEDKSKRMMKHGYDGWWKRMQAALEKGAPIFVLTPDNHTRMVYDVNLEKRTFKVAQGDIHPADMTDLPGIYQQHLGEEEKKEAVLRQISKVKHLLSEEEMQRYTSSP